MIDEFNEPCCDGSDDDLSAEELEEYATSYIHNIYHKSIIITNLSL